ncbi:MAG: DNA-binding protein Alba [Thaumarchaeota archaeon]|nr:DNA-binding protein Alba [Nitrososphaerota archaeon]
MSTDSNTVFVGKKPVMNYVLACITLFQNGMNDVVIKARGRAISRAVDVAQILMKRFMNDLKVKNIAIDTEELKNEETGRVSNVSTIEIHLSK